MNGLLFILLALAAPVETLALKGSQHSKNNAEHLTRKVESRIDTQGRHPAAIRRLLTVHAV